MKTYVHARLSRAERATLEQVKKATGRSESQIIRRGLALAAREAVGQPSALAVAGRSVGRFRNGPPDLSINPKQLEGFGR